MAKLIDLSHIKISAHALKRFKERWPSSREPENWEKIIRKLLSETEEIFKRPLAHLKALIKYQEGARYFHNSGWVFVINEGMISLVTTERLKDCPELWEKPKKPKKRKHRR